MIIGLIIGLLLFIVVAALLIPYLLGLTKILVTMPEEGTIEAIMKGKKSHRFVMAFAGHHLNEPGIPGYNSAFDDWEVLPGDPVRDRSVLGMYWVGIPPWYKVNWYRFRWTEWSQPQNNTTNVAVPREELTSFIFVKDFPYYARVENAKTNSRNPKDAGELVPVNMEYVLTLKCTNPNKARFVTEDWLARAISILDAESRNYIGERTYEDMASERDLKNSKGTNVKGNDSLCTQLLKLNRKMSDGLPGLKKSIGIELVGVNIISVGLTSEAEKLLGAATTRKYVARREADAKEIEADGRARSAVKDAEATKTAAGAEAFRIKTVSDAMKNGGEQAIAAMYFDSISKAGASGSSIIFGAKPGEISKDTLVFGSFVKQQAAGNKKGGTK